MMKVLVVLVALVYAAAGNYQDDCQYISTDGEVYSLNYFGGWINKTATNGDQWFINPCPSFIWDTQPCPQDASVCVTSSQGVTSIRGLKNSSLISDAAVGTQGVEVMYSSPDVCSSGVNYKTVIEFVCVQSDDSWTIVDDNLCTVTHTIQSSDACPISHVYLDGDMPSSYVVIEAEHAAFQMFFILIALISCCCLMCCCCLRRRRCQKAKAIQMQQFSNVAFQPIPSAQQSLKATEMAPSYNPYVAQPQYFYYYPTQQEMHEAVPLDTISSDEKMAKELQAQFNQEAQM